MKNKLYLLLAITFLISCKSESEKSENNKAPEKTVIEKVTDEAGKILPENVYEFKDGKKGDKIFIIEGTKLFLVDNNKKELILEKRGNKVYDFSNGEDGSKPVFIFEGEKYWEIDKKTGEKSKLVFERKGNIIYSNENEKLIEAFIVE